MTNTSDSSRPEISSRDTNIRDFRATRTACVAEVCSLCSQLNKMLYFSWRLVKCGCSSFLIQVRGPPCGLHVILPFRRHHCHCCSLGHRTSILCDLPLSTRDLLQFILPIAARIVFLREQNANPFSSALCSSIAFHRFLDLNLVMLKRLPDPSSAWPGLRPSAPRRPSRGHAVLQSSVGFVLPVACYPQ